MNRFQTTVFLAVLTIGAVVAQPGPRSGQAASQGGDQLLDGIGETGLIARYLFNGNAEDSSRNQLHATLRGQGGVCVEDGSRRVLLLTGEGSHAELPSSALAGEDALAVTAWLYLPTRASGPIFDFGQGLNTRLMASVDAQQNLRAGALVGA